MAPGGGLTTANKGYLEINELNFTWLGDNATSVEIGAQNYTMHSGPWFWPWCPLWKSPQHAIFQITNALFVASYSAPNTKKGQLWMHTVLIFAFMLYSVWSWHVICAADAFSWNFAFVMLNVAQVVYIVYDMRPVKFDPELEEVYHTLFLPFKIGRLQFKRMVSAEFAQIMSLHAGEAYAMQNLTKTDRLGLLLSGKVNVMSGPQFLHPILPCEFLDSPEFESSRANIDEKFKVSIVAASSCRYLYWQRSALEYLFVKETYLGTVVSTLIARDITTKLYAMNNKIVTEKGSHLDIRLPGITSCLVAAGEYRSPPRFVRGARPRYHAGCGPMSPESLTSGGSGGGWREGGAAEELEPLARPNEGSEDTPEEQEEEASVDELSVGQDSYLDTSSKYHSCEAVETDEELRH